MLVALLAAGFYAWKLEHDPSEEKTAKVEFLGNFREEDLQRISVVRAEESYAIIRDEDHPNTWTLKNPEHATLDSKRFQSMLQALGKLGKLDTIEKDELEPDERVYGLQPPELVLTVEGTFGKRVLSFGKKIAITNRRYAQPQGENRLFLVGEEIFTVFNTSKSEVRDHFPVKFSAKDVTEFVAVRGENDFLKFVRNEQNGQWTLSFPGGQFIADSEFINSKLADFGKIRVKRFVDEPGENFALYGLSVPKLIVQITLAPDSRKLVFQIGEGVSMADTSRGADPTLVAEKAYFLKVLGQPFIYELTRASTGDFLQAPESFRPRQPLKFLDPSRVERIEIVSQGEPCKLERDASHTWAAQCAGQTQEVPNGFVDKWLGGLSSLNVLSYPALQSSTSQDNGLKIPLVTYKIFLKERALPLILALGSTLSSPKKLNEDPDAAPRWIALSQEDGAFLPAIVNSGIYERLSELLNQLRK